MSTITSRVTDSLITQTDPCLYRYTLSGERRRLLCGPLYQTDHSQDLKLSQDSGCIGKASTLGSSCLRVDPALLVLEGRGRGVKLMCHTTVKFEVSLAYRTWLKSSTNIEDLIRASHQTGCNLLTFGRFGRLSTRGGRGSSWHSGTRGFRCLYRKFETASCRIGSVA
jgi:hypothetical protein